MARRSVTDIDRLLTRAINLMDAYKKLARDNAFRIHPDRRDPYINAVDALESQRCAVWSDALKANHVHDTTPRDTAIKGS